MGKKMSCVLALLLVAALAMGCGAHDVVGAWVFNTDIDMEEAAALGMEAEAELITGMVGAEVVFDSEGNAEARVDGNRMRTFTYALDGNNVLLYSLGAEQADMVLELHGNEMRVDGVVVLKKK